jgi:long-chain-fatty-acid--[acyl-carrier-protein] ligase
MWKECVSRLILYPVVWLVRLLIFLRYRLVVKGLNELTPHALKRSGGILFLPNHVAEIDPVILESILWPKFHPRPLVIERFYSLKGFGVLMRLVKALPLPNVDVVLNKWRGKKVEKQFNNVVSLLKNRENFLIYPSGRLKISGLESIGGASFAHKLLQAAPETNVVLVRVVGLWGSKFSRALTGSSPEFGKVLLECLKILLKNGIFFAPRREVIVEFAHPPADFPYAGARLEFNQFLERWYNHYPEEGPEPLKLVSYAFWKSDMPSVFVSTGAPHTQQRPVEAKIQREVFAHLAPLCGKSPEQMDRKMRLSQDLGLDSLDVVQVYVFLDEHYGVSDLLPGDVQTVEDVLQFASGYKKEREDRGGEGAVRSFAWPKEKRDTPCIPEGETIQEVFLYTAHRYGSLIAAVDALSGSLDYVTLKRGALILSEKISKLPGDAIGVMLPASSGAYLVILSVLLAGKVPVMLNWTAGAKSLDHSVDLAGVQVVITSEKFLDRLENDDLGKLEEKLRFIEEMRLSISLKDKFRAVFLGYKSPKALLKKLGLSSIKGTSTAVILFTSGTESLPKGVPLSHANLLSNQRAAMEAVSMSAEEILYGVLPPFHSFGFSVTGLLPLLAGMRVCYAPDPTDSHGLARDIDRWKPTLFCAAPSFIKAVFRVADPSQLQSLRLVVSGAEKAGQDLFDYVKDHLPGAYFLEGYGITECSPVVTLDRLGEPHKGVGKPIPGVELMILDQQTLQRAGGGQEGEVCVAGPNVFAGYLGRPRDPFFTLEGKKWYLSGDRGYLDSQGYLILSGRLKRFIKIGGEMVSLGGLEDELVRLAKEKNWLKEMGEGPVLAVSTRGAEADKPNIILFTTFSVSKEDANAALKECGYGRIVKISEVRILDQIPLTGTGKTHYRLLDEL